MSKPNRALQEALAAAKASEEKDGDFDDDEIIVLPAPDQQYYAKDAKGDSDDDACGEMSSSSHQISAYADAKSIPDVFGPTERPSEKEITAKMEMEDRDLVEQDIRDVGMTEGKLGSDYNNLIVFYIFF